MSGPKSSSYTLSAQQRAILLEQQRFAQESRRREELISQICAVLGNADKPLSRIDKLDSESGQKNKDALKISGQINAAARQLEVLKSKVPKSSGELKALNKELQNVLSGAVNSVDAANTIAASYEKSYRRELDKVIESGFNLSFSVIENAHIRRINEIIDCIGDVPSPLRGRLNEIRAQANEIKSPDYLKNFLAVVVTPFAKACRDCAGYDEALSAYRLLAKEAKVKEQSFDCSPEGLSALKAESERLEKEILEDRERTYINEALDAAMREMGYELVGDRMQIKKTGKHVRHELYTLNNGTAVDVTYADNGQISMELGGVAANDRAPTFEESEQLTEDMRAFCGDYAALEQKLIERGVLTANISHMPPSSEYAQIFNINDYNVLKPVKAYEARSRRSAVQKHNGVKTYD